MTVFLLIIIVPSPDTRLYHLSLSFSLFAKIAGAGGFDAHTDAPAYQHSGALKHLTINVAVDAATTENGCLEVVDGSHKM